jgi:hypothetical protein
MNDFPPKPGRFAFLAVLGSGILVAATGVGAGDLLTASYAGSRHGLVLLWAAWLGAVLTLIIIGSRVQLEKGPSMALELASSAERWARRASGSSSPASGERCSPASSVSGRARPTSSPIS